MSATSRWIFPLQKKNLKKLIVSLSQLSYPHDSFPVGVETFMVQSVFSLVVSGTFSDYRVQRKTKLKKFRRIIVLIYHNSIPGLDFGLSNHLHYLLDLKNVYIRYIIYLQYFHVKYHGKSLCDVIDMLLWQFITPQWSTSFANTQAKKSFFFSFLDHSN